MFKLAVFISGRGSNLEAIQRNIETGILKGSAKIQVVISNKSDAKGLLFAQSHNIKTAVCPNEPAILEELAKHQIDLICLAGFMRIITPALIKKYPQKIINIHPTLLPKFPGLHVHEKVLAAKETESGCTVHYVDEGVDTGKIIAQAKVPVVLGDTPDSLAGRVLVEEHKLYSKVIRELANAHH